MKTPPFQKTDNHAKDALVTAGGTGEAGQTMLAKGHRIRKARGPVGRGVESNKPVLVSDKRQTLVALTTAALGQELKGEAQK